MVITNRNLAPGTRLVAKFKGQQVACLVGEVEGQKVYQIVGNGQTLHKSPSAAGSAIMGGTACNGWRFWSVEGEQTEAAETAPRASSRPTARKGSTPRILYRVPNQKGAPEGSVRFWCNACMKSFDHEGEDRPEACPEGHRADDQELLGDAGVTPKQEAAAAEPEREPAEALA